MPTPETPTNSDPRRKVVIVGASARAAADSATRAGFDPFSIDLFNDRDLRVPALLCPLREYPHAIPCLLDAGPHEWKNAPVILTGAMENHLETVRSIAAKRPLMFAGANAIAASRDPLLWRRLRGMIHAMVCETRVPGEDLTAVTAGGTWLLKPLYSSAGHGIRPMESLPTKLPTTHYAQEFIEGTPVSAVYHATHDTSALLGVTQQIIGDPRFGARAFQYVGNFGPVHDRMLSMAFAELGGEVVRNTSLTGVFGIDAIVDSQGRVRPLEINPRFPASAEVLELAGRSSVLLPESATHEAIHSGVVAGKAIAYARAASTMPDLFELFDRDDIADVPAIGETIPQGRPICTLRAKVSNTNACIERLHTLADELYTRLRA